MKCLEDANLRVYYSFFVLLSFGLVLTAHQIPQQECSKPQECSTFDDLGNAACVQSACPLHPLSTEASYRIHPSHSASASNRSSYHHTAKKCCQGLAKGHPCLPSKIQTCQTPFECLALKEDWICQEASHLNRTESASADQLKSSQLWIVGLVMAILGAVMGSLAFNVQKYSFRIEGSRQKKRMIWLSGFLLFILGNIGTLVALMYTTQSLIAPLGSTGLITNALFAYWMNHELFEWTDYAGLALCILGSLLVVLMGDLETTAGPFFLTFSLDILLSAISSCDLDLSISEIVKRLSQTSSIVLICLTTLTLAPCLVYIFILETRANQQDITAATRAARVRASTTAMATAANFGLLTSSFSFLTDPEQEEQDEMDESQQPLIERANESIESLLALATSQSATVAPSPLPPPSPSSRQQAIGFKEKRSSRLRNLALPCLYPFIAGTFAATVTLLAKCLMGMIHLTLNGENQFTYWPSYGLLLLLLFLVPSQLVLFNQGLKKFDASIQVPIFNTAYTIISILDGMIYFSEGVKLTSVHLCCFILGVLLTCLGSFFLAFRVLRKLPIELL